MLVAAIVAIPMDVDNCREEQAERECDGGGGAGGRTGGEERARTWRGGGGHTRESWGRWGGGAWRRGCRGWGSCFGGTRRA